MARRLEMNVNGIIKMVLSKASLNFTPFKPALERAVLLSKKDDKYLPENG